MIFEAKTCAARQVEDDFYEHAAPMELEGIVETIIYKYASPMGFQIEDLVRIL